jgi:hypothetical protein
MSFWSCTERLAAAIFVEWADSLFPRCEHGVPSTVRRVLKEGANNGRHFYTCCRGGTSQPACFFFQWVEDEHENRMRQVPTLLLASVAAAACASTAVFATAAHTSL